jgi:hypothetical protein
VEDAPHVGWVQGEVTFTSYRATLNEAIIAMFTGANVPQFWMPAFNQQRISALVFMGELPTLALHVVSASCPSNEGPAHVYVRAGSRHFISRTCALQTTFPRTNKHFA